MRFPLFLSLAISGAAHACPTCRPLVQAGIHNAQFVPHLGLMMLPPGLLIGMALAIYRVK